MIDKIVKTCLADKVYIQIKKHIFSGEYKEGNLLPSENKLSKHLNVSRVVVRDALERLREEKIIVTYKGKGSFLANPENFSSKDYLTNALDFKKFKQIMDFRFIIENFSIKQAVKVASDEELKLIKLKSDKMREYMNDLNAFNNADYEFHLQIVKCSKNPLFVSAIENAKSEILACLNAMNSLPCSREFALDLHDKIANAFIERNDNEIINLLKNNGEYNQARMNNLLFKGEKNENY